VWTHVGSYGILKDVNASSGKDAPLCALLSTLRLVNARPKPS